MFKLPTQKKRWIQSNGTDLLGNISVTKNITFDESGYLALSNSPRAAINNSVDADFDLPAVILKSDDYDYFVGTWDDAFQVDTEILATRPTQITTSGVPATDIQTDAVWVDGFMAVSQDTDLDYYDPATNSWTDTDISLTSNGQHQTVNFLSLKSLAVVNVNTVKLYALPLAASPTLVTTLTISSDYEITGACYFNQNMFIATQNIYGDKAAVYVWNGLGTSASQVYEVDSSTIYSICPHKGTVYIVASNGSLLMFNGSGFEFVDAFPIFHLDQSLTDENLNLSMYKNVMKSNGDVIYISFSNENNSAKRLLDQPDGIWCYDEDVGLYHRYSFSNSLVNIETIATASVNTTTNQITVATANVTGTEVYYQNGGGTSITELTDDTKYFTIYVDATHIKLATTLANANAGTAIDLTGTGNNAQKLIFFPNIDYGQTLARRTAALSLVQNGGSAYGTDLIWGAEVIRRDNTADYETLGSVSNGVESRGHFITSRYNSENITDTFNQLAVKYSPFTSEMDKIIVKYRVESDMRKFINISSSGWAITWTSSTSFTTTQADWADAVVGDEIEVLEGAAGGLLAHISEISSISGTYTVTIDETYSNYTSGDIGRAVFRNWKKILTIDTTEPFNYKTQEIGQQGKFIQFKVELRGIGVRIEELLLDGVPLLPIRN